MRQIRKSIEYQLNDAAVIHNNKYDYSKVEYIKFDIKITIICPLHGEFKQRAYEHSKGAGCPKCGIVTFSKKNGITSSEWISKMSAKYPNMDFSETIFVRYRTKVTIRCPKHGYYTTTPRQLLKSAGCLKCGRERAAKYSQDHSYFWSKPQWSEKAQNSKNFDSFKVYIIQCKSAKEVFYKIGRTFTTVAHRFRHASFLPYEYNIIKELVFDNAKDAYEKEAELKEKNSIHKYLPLIKFPGMHECFLNVK